MELQEKLHMAKLKALPIVIASSMAMFGAV